MRRRRSANTPCAASRSIRPIATIPRGCRRSAAASHGAVDIAAGPNNPVGAVWIALSADTYGIHGAPNPSQVSKTQSHGCIRLTNWDAVELGRAVRPGVPVAIRESSVAQRATRSRLDYQRRTRPVSTWMKSEAS